MLRYYLNPPLHRMCNKLKEHLMATKKPNPFLKMTEVKDKAMDKKAGVKEDSKADE
jgi:hypothetical protein